MNPTGVRRNFAKLFFLLALLAGFGVSAQAQEIVTTPTGSKLEVWVTPEKGKILPGEPIDVAVSYRFLKSEDWSPFREWRQDVWPTVEGKTAITILDANGNRVAGREVEFYPGYRAEYAALRSPSRRDVFTRTFFLPDWATIKTPGTYRIRIQTEFCTARERFARQNEPQPVEFSVSGEGRLEVLPPDPARLSIIARETGREAVKTDFNEYWDRLYLIDSPAVAPFLARQLKKWVHRSSRYRITETELTRSLEPGDEPTEIEPAGLLPISLAYLTSSKPVDPIERELPKLIETLARFHDDETADALAEASRYRNPAIRKVVAVNLGRFATPRAFLILAAMRKDRDETVRAAVADGLRADPTPETERILLEMLRDKDEDVRDAARQSLETRQSANPK